MSPFSVSTLSTLNVALCCAHLLVFVLFNLLILVLVLVDYTSSPGTLKLAWFWSDLITRPNPPCRTPNHEHIILPSACKCPLVVHVRCPGNIGDAGDMTPMDEQKLWWTVLGVIWRLLLANLRKIPYIDTSVAGARCKNGRDVG